jgi:hypothetical protein
MSSIPLLSGVTNVIKITPNNSLIPGSVNNVNNLFKLSNLTDSKFDDFLSIANSGTKIAVVDDQAEIPKFIDSDFNNTTPQGSLWFLGNVEQNKSFYIETGSSLSIENSSSTIADQYNSYSFTETSGNIIDRCQLRDGVPINDITYQVDGVISKGVKFGPTAGSRFNLSTMPYLSDLTNLSIVAVIKIPGNTDFFSWDWMQCALSSGALALFFNQNDYNFYVNTMPSDSYCFVAFLWDGTKTGNDRITAYVNNVKQTNIIFSDHTGNGRTPTNLANYGQIGPLTSVPNDLEIDEFRIYNRTLSEDEIIILYNQWFNQSNYWTVTIKPVISSVVSLGANTWQITGSGFKPGSTDPTGTIGGISFTVKSGSTDTSIIITEGEGTPPGIQILNIRNSDNEIDYVSMVTSVKRNHSENSPETLIGMPSKDNSVAGLNIHKDEKFGNPLGDVVDNNSGINLADGSAESKPIQTSRGSSGHSLSMYSKPSWLYP